MKVDYKGCFTGLYILAGHEPMPVDDPIEWADWYEHNDRRLAEDEINGFRVSTVFLGTHSDLLGGTPLLFETMVFSTTETIESPLLQQQFYKSLDTLTSRYASWDEALAGHAQTLSLIREGAF